MKTVTIKSLLIALFAAFISAGCFIAIPVGPGGIPIVLQNMMAIVAGCLLGGFNGAASVVLFLIAGALGLPIFSGGHGGFAILTGPTGGFLFGYAFGALVTGLIMGVPTQDEKAFSLSQLIKLTIAATIGYILVYIPGIIWFMFLRHASLAKTLAACVLPFIPGDIIKIVLTVIISAKLRTITAMYLHTED
ncbi:MAG: biotin transporter BioY [Treponema sp.]|nr:biotin transporter BioY [Treponema sp.]